MNLDFQTPLRDLKLLTDDLVGIVPRLILATAAFVIFFFVARLVKRLVHGAALQARAPQTGALVLGRLAQWTTVLLGLLVALTVLLPTFKAGQLIQLLGISSVAVGFAFRDILTNFLAGLIILLTQPFRIGDQIVVNSYEGTVEDIKTRATVIHTYDGRRVLIPNATVFTQAVTVNTAFTARRSECQVEVNSARVDEARDRLVAAMLAVEGVRADPAPQALVWGFDDGTFLRLLWWTDSVKADVVQIQGAVLAAVNEVLNQDDIAAPPTQQEIFLHDLPASSRAGGGDGREPGAEGAGQRRPGTTAQP